MTLLGIPLAQLALLFAGTAALVGLLYLVRLRPRRAIVAFAALWTQVSSERQASSVWRRLRRVASLLIQLLIVFLLVAALGDPQLSDRWLHGRHIVLLLDTSASMQATDTSEGTRMDAALAAARAFVRNMRGRDRMMIVRVDHRVAPLTPYTADRKSLLAALAGVRASETADDMTRAVHFCIDALRGHPDPLLIVVGDGTYRPTPFRPILAANGAVELQFITVGHSTDNIGIVAFSARRDPTDRASLALLLELVNYRASPVSLDVQLISDGVLADVRRIDLEAGQRVRYACDTRDEAFGDQPDWCGIHAAGQVLEARLTAGEPRRETPPGPGSSAALDAFGLDDRAFAVVPPRRLMRVLLVTSGNLFLEAALLPLENVDLQRAQPKDLTSELANGFDVIVLDGLHAPDNLSADLLWIAPPANESGTTGSGKVTDPLITDQNTEHPAMQNITLKDVNMLEARRLLRERGDVVLAASFRQPLIIARERKGHRQVIVGFDVKRSDLPLRIAFPLLLANAIEWFAGEQPTGAVSVLRVGHTWRIPLAPANFPASDGSATVITPAGNRITAPIHDGRATLHGDEIGVYELRRDTSRLRIAANLSDAHESDIGSRASQLLREHRVRPPTGLRGWVSRGLWIYLVVVGLALLVLEWVTYNRRITV